MVTGWSTGRAREAMGTVASPVGRRGSWPALARRFLRRQSQNCHQ